MGTSFQYTQGSAYVQLCARFSGLFMQIQAPCCKPSELYLHRYKHAEQQSCTGKATKQPQCGGVGYRCRSRAAWHEWTTPYTEGRWLCTKDCPWGLAGTTARTGTHHPGSFSYLQMICLRRRKGSALKQGAKSACAELQTVIKCHTRTDSFLTLFGVAAPKHTDQSVSGLFSNVC